MERRLSAETPSEMKERIWFTSLYKGHLFSRFFTRNVHAKVNRRGEKNNTNNNKKKKKT